MFFSINVSVDFSFPLSFHFVMQAIQKSGSTAREPLHSIWSCVRGFLKHTTCYYYFLDLILRPLLPHHHRSRLVRASIYFIIVIIDIVSLLFTYSRISIIFYICLFLIITRSLSTWHALIRVLCRFIHWRWYMSSHQFTAISTLSTIICKNILQAQKVWNWSNSRYSVECLSHFNV